MGTDIAGPGKFKRSALDIRSQSQLAENRTYLHLNNVSKSGQETRLSGRKAKL